MFGSGSMIQTLDLDKEIESSDVGSLLKAGLRFFTPIEVARLHYFPVDDTRLDDPRRKQFEFPTNITRRQQWQLLGNSLNVFVVSELIRENLY